MVKLFTGYIGVNSRFGVSLGMANVDVLSLLVVTAGKKTNLETSTAPIIIAREEKKSLKNIIQVEMME